MLLNGGNFVCINECFFQFSQALVCRINKLIELVYLGLQTLLVWRSKRLVLVHRFAKFLRNFGFTDFDFTRLYVGCCLNLSRRITSRLAQLLQLFLFLAWGLNRWLALGAFNRGKLTCLLVQLGQFSIKLLAIRRYLIKLILVLGFCFFYLLFLLGNLIGRRFCFLQRSKLLFTGIVVIPQIVQLLEE